jgi:putative cell wall-binding protein
VVVGGVGVVSDEVVAELGAFTEGTVVRLSGSDRYSTTAAVSSAFFSPEVPVAYVATGDTFPDALAGAYAAAYAGGPLLLVAPDALPLATARELRRLQPRSIVVLGGPAAVSEFVRSALVDYVVTP